MIRENVSLRDHNTFGIDVRASYFMEVSSRDELGHLLDTIAQHKDFMILGGGSNVLFTKDFDGLIVKNKLQGMAVIREDADHVWLWAASGELWHDVVEFAVDRNLGGIENLSLIPGSVGAAPMQNIGAYGVEIKEVLVEVEAINLFDGGFRTFTNEDCAFGYRESVFKHEEKGKYFITSILLRLKKQPEFKLTYGAIGQTLEEMGIKEPTVRAVSNAVIFIRRSKLPDPALIGNAGSFFKNPEVSVEQFAGLKEKYPDLVAYDMPSGNKKLAAAWLIEQAGWKGKDMGKYGVHKQQALVLVNYNGANGKEIYNLAQSIKSSVQEKFGVILQEEVNIV